VARCRPPSASSAPAPGHTTSDLAAGTSSGARYWRSGGAPDDPATVRSVLSGVGVASSGSVHAPRSSAATNATTSARVPRGARARRRTGRAPGGRPTAGARFVTSRPASHRLDEAFDALVDAPERVLAQHGALRLVIELEMDPVDRVVPPRLLRGAHEVATQLGTGRLRRDGGRLEHLQVGRHALDHPAGREQVVQPLGARDAVVREVEPRDARVVELQPVLRPVAMDEPVLDAPVELAVDERQVARLQGAKPALPQVEHLLDDGRGRHVLLDELLDALQVLALQVDRRDRPAARELHRLLARHVVADLADRADGVLERE